MLIQKNGSYYASAPVKLSLYSKESGFVMVGNEDTRIVLTREEIQELYGLLEPFVNAKKANGRSSV